MPWRQSIYQARSTRYPRQVGQFLKHCFSIDVWGQDGERLSVPSLHEILIIGSIIVIVFSARKLPALGSAIGSSFKSFKKGIKGERDERDVTPDANDSKDPSKNA